MVRDNLIIVSMFVSVSYLILVHLNTMGVTNGAWSHKMYKSIEQAGAIGISKRQSAHLLLPLL